MEREREREREREDFCVREVKIGCLCERWVEREREREREGCLSTNLS